MALFEKVTLWPLVAFMILFGVYPTPILSFFNTAFYRPDERAGGGMKLRWSSLKLN